MTDDITALRRRITVLKCRVRRRTATIALMIGGVVLVGAAADPPATEPAMGAPVMTHVQGIGGIFIESDDPARLAGWYRDVLGISMDAHPDGSQFYHVFWTRDFTTSQPRENPIFAIQPRSKPDGVTSGFTLGFRVDDMDATLADLRGKGVEIDPNGLDWERGRHRRVRDLDGNVIELYQEIGTQEIGTPPLPDDGK